MTTTSPGSRVLGPAAKPVVAGAKKGRSPIAGRPVTAYLFMLPYLVLFGTFVVGPAIYGLWISLHAWDPQLPNKPWVGFENYKDLFTAGTTTSGPFWNSMEATGKFMLFSIPLLIVIPLGIAVALVPVFRGRNLLRGIFFAPFVLGVAVIGLLWRYLLDPNVGVVNSFLTRMGMDSPPAWTTDTPWVWFALVIPTLWWTVGYNTVIFLAGLQDISKELYEAADIDGANKWQKFRNVTIPGLRPVLVFVVTITILASANVFGQPYLITQGQPGRETRSVIMQIGEEGLRRFQMGSAAAMSTIMTLSLIVISLLAWFVMREKKEAR